MDLIKAENKMLNLMEKHNISNWSFGFDRAVKRLGHCIWMKNGRKVRKITLSRVMTESRSEKEVENTMLHEIAHAIDYETRGFSSHDNIWKEIALSIGCDGQRTNKVDKKIVKNNYKWLAICSEHGVLGGWQRKPKDNKICKKCGNKVKIKKNE